jgi:hypothetical protein
MRQSGEQGHQLRSKIGILVCERFRHHPRAVTQACNQGMLEMSDVGLAIEWHKLACMHSSYSQWTPSTSTNFGTLAAESDAEEDKHGDDDYKLDQQSHVPQDHAPDKQRGTYMSEMPESGGPTRSNLPISVEIIRAEVNT